MPQEPHPTTRVIMIGQGQGGDYTSPSQGICLGAQGHPGGAELEIKPGPNLAWIKLCSLVLNNCCPQGKEEGERATGPLWIALDQGNGYLVHTQYRDKERFSEEKAKLGPTC